MLNPVTVGDRDRREVGGKGAVSDAVAVIRRHGAARQGRTAVDAAGAGEEIVVTNGVYASGGRAAGTNVLVNRVAVDKPLTLRSVSG